MIKALKMLFLVITRIPVTKIQFSIVKHRIRKVIRLAEIGYIDKNEASKTIDRLMHMYNYRNKVFDETVREYLKGEKRNDVDNQG